MLAHPPEFGEFTASACKGGRLTCCRRYLHAPPSSQGYGFILPLTPAVASCASHFSTWPPYGHDSLAKKHTKSSSYTRSGSHGIARDSPCVPWSIHDAM